jgi:hypothetical protein
MNFPTIVSDSNCSTSGLIADTIMAHGLSYAAFAFRKKLCFSLFYFAAFGKMPRALKSPPHSFIRRAS